MADETIRIELDCSAESFHMHYELEILYVLSGRTAVMLRDSNVVLESEQFIVFNPHEDHGLYRTPGSHTLSFYIPISIIREGDLGYISCCSKLLPEKEDFLNLIRIKLAQLFKAVYEQKRSRLYILSQLYGLLSILAQEFSSDRDTPDRDPHVTQALRYIGDHFTENISLSDTADAVHISKSHLSRIFQKQTGTTFVKYVNSLRLSLASVLLQNTNKSILEIALETGFSNSNSLNANFREVYGCTPSAYRRDSAAANKRTDKDSSLPDDVSYMALLKYSALEENTMPLTKRRSGQTVISADMTRTLGSFRSCHRKAISVGRAVNLLTENLREPIRKAKRRTDFKYASIQGILDDSMHVYHETPDGDFRLNYNYIDTAIDFLLQGSLCFQKLY